MEWREIATHIQGETMHRDPMAHTDADGCNLALADPNARESIALCRRNPVFGEKFDEQLLEPAQVTMQVLAASAKIDNWISHQLSGAVISRLTAAIDRKKRMRQMQRTEQTRLIGRAADCVNRFMFEQQHFVGRRTIFS